MKQQALVRPAAAWLGALAMAGALAQTVPETSGGKPLPAEDRSSSGAVELERSPVRAKRDRDAALPSQRIGADPAVTDPTFTDLAPRPTTRAQARAERAKKRAAAAELRRSGQGGRSGKSDAGAPVEALSRP